MKIYSNTRLARAALIVVGVAWIAGGIRLATSHG